MREYQSRYVKEFDDYEFIYETEECEYEIKAGSDVSFEDDLEKGKYVLELEYGDGIGLYRTDIEKKFAVVNTNTGRMVNIYMDCDLDSAEKKITEVVMIYKEKRWSNLTIFLCFALKFFSSLFWMV